MPLPKRRHSHTRGAKRRTHEKANVPTVVDCSHCGRPKPHHTICPECGHYDNRPVLKGKPEE